jgi:hypothetical protein
MKTTALISIGGSILAMYLSHLMFGWFLFEIIKVPHTHRPYFRSESNH